VSGAIQDHDRGLIVGETTFGKALVQSVHQISEGAGLFLTTARYYTPSGRLIQRPWDATFDEYRYSERDLKPADHALSERRLTDGGREVFGGGGIEPDYVMAGPIEGFAPTALGRRLAARQEFADFAERFSAEGDTRIKVEGRGRQRVSRGFVIDDAMMADFRSQLESRGLTIDDEAEEAFASDEAFIRAMMHYEIDIALFGLAAARRSLTASDPQVRYAVTLFPEAVRLLNVSRQTDAVAARRN
jgi:carboxyl-terminal processing protease